MDFTGMSDALAGIGKAIEKNPETFSSVLGSFGQAISPQDSWQSRLGGAAADMGQQELQRQFLQQLLGGGGAEGGGVNDLFSGGATAPAGIGTSGPGGSTDVTGLLSSMFG